MKQYIVLISTIVLGIFIFNAVAGSGEYSLLSLTKKLWYSEVCERTYNP